MYRRAKDKGFSLISAIFIVVILSLLTGYALILFSMSQATSNFTLQGTRAFFSAKSGIQWAIHQIKNTPTACPSTTTLNLTQAGLKGFKVQVSCVKTSYTEGVTQRNLFRIDSIATLSPLNLANPLDDPGYVSRRLQVVLNF